MAKKILLQHEVQVVEVEWIRSIEEDIFRVRESARFRGGEDLVRDVSKLENADRFRNRGESVKDMLESSVRHYCRARRRWSGVLSIWDRS